MRLTDRIVKALPAPVRGNKITFDSDAVKGFGCRVTAAGTKAFVLRYRRRSDARQRLYTIGSFPDWSVGAARDEAKRLKRAIDGGDDPVGAIQDSRAAPTIADLCARFLKEHLPRVRPATQRDYKQQIGVDILPVLGKSKVAAVTHADVDAFHRRISDRAPTHANRVLACLSKMFSLSVRWGWRETNPCEGVERNQEQKRQRYLSADELTRLTTALAELPDRGAANAVRLLLLTGARRGELLAARWADFDLEAGVWIKPGATTKQKTTHRVPLSKAACRLLGKMNVGDSEYLFPARRTPHRLDIDDAWNALRKTADISDVRLHDLRHTYASVLASQGLSLPIIGALLGHTVANTTLRYAHLLDDPLRQATERAAAVITGKPAAEIVLIKGEAGMKTPPWLEAEIEQEFFATLMAKIKDGTALTRSEREVLQRLIKERPKQARRRGRPSDGLEPWSSTWRLGMACRMRELNGEPLKVAVEYVAYNNGVSRRSVYDARKRLLCKRFE